MAASVILLSACLVAIYLDQFQVLYYQFILGVAELQQSHHITSTFLPIGYPLWIAWTFSLGSHWGTWGSQHAFELMNVVMLLVLFMFLRTLMQRFSPNRFATIASLIIVIRPEMLHNLSKVSDANITTMFLVVLMYCADWLKKSTSVLSALSFGLVYGLGVLVRPNFGIAIFILVWSLWKLPFVSQLKLVLLSTIMSISIFAAITAGIHGQPFFPQNGPYNMFAGANSYTGAALYEFGNAEPSIPRAMHDLGFNCSVDWVRPSDITGVNDCRDLRYKAIYQQQIWRFLITSPGSVIKLDFEKTLNFLRPETNRFKFDGPFNRITVPWLLARLVDAMIVPLWIAMLFWAKRNAWQMDWLLVVLAILYVLPFVLTNSDPRFRWPLIVLVLADMARIFYTAWKANGRNLSSSRLIGKSLQ